MSARTARAAGLDTLKGLLVVMMVFCHVLQFFADTRAFPHALIWMESINVLVFPCFLFVFGRTAWLAYLSKTFRVAWPRMARQAAVLYGAFCLSGIGHRVLAENKPLRERTVSGIMALRDIPGWSEFLIAFALLSLLVLVGFKLWHWLLDRSVILGFVCTLPILASALIPYSQIGSVHLALFIGGTQFAYFPALLYMPYMLLGMTAQRYGMRKPLWWLLGGALASLPGIIATVTEGYPSRFPPSPLWLMMPALGVVLLSLATDRWTRYRDASTGRIRLHPALRTVTRIPGLAVKHMGRHSLYYLLASNLVIFTLHGKRITPELTLRSGIPWRLPISSIPGAAVWTVVLLGCIGLTLSLAGARKSES
ncbi:MAG: hypothetical protein FWG37_01120 [Clostridia bacterium]|nr:hypothetical protein [Clostridia bacterium]